MASDALREIYLVSASYVHSPEDETRWDSQLYTAARNLTTRTSLEIRVGFGSTCVRLADDPNPFIAQWQCSQDAGSLAVAFSERQDPLGLVYYGTHFAGGIVFYGLLYVFIYHWFQRISARTNLNDSAACVVLDFLAFVLLGTFPGWHTTIDENGSEHEVKPFPGRPVTQAIAYVLMVAVILGFVSVVWLHSAAAAAVGILEYGFAGLVDAKVGTVSMLLAWLGLFCTIVSLMGIIVMILSLQLLDRLVEEEEEEE